MRGMCWKRWFFNFIYPFTDLAGCQSNITGANLSWYSYSPACFLWNSLVVKISSWFPIAFLCPFPKRFPQSYLRWVSYLHKGFPCQCCWCSLSWQLHFSAKPTAPEGCASADQTFRKGCRTGASMDFVLQERSATRLFWGKYFPILRYLWRTQVWILSLKVWFSGGHKDSALL